MSSSSQTTVVSLPAATALPLPPNPVRNILNERDSSYIVTKADLRHFLERKFHRSDFEISTKNGRWLFMAPEKVSANDIKEWIREIQATADRERAERTASAAAAAVSEAIGTT